MLVWFLLYFCVLWVFPVQAATYYLNPASGSDGGTGAIGSPWKTLFKVKTTVAAGDTVNIVGGTYTQAQVQGEGGTPTWTSAQSLGSTGTPIIIQAKPGETVTFTGGGSTYWQRFYSTSSSYAGHFIVVQNMTFQNYDGAVIGIEGSSSTTKAKNVAVVNCRFLTLGSNGSGLFSGNTQQVIFKDNYLSNLGTHGIYVSDGSNFMVVTGNTVLGAGDNGTGPSGGAWNIHVWGGHGLAPSTNNVIVRQNIMVNGLSGSLIVAGIIYNNVYVYNNSAYNDSSHSVNDGVWTTHNGGTYNHFITKNNIGYGYADTGQVYSDPGQAYGAGFILDYNMWKRLNGVLYTWNGTTYSLAAFQAALGYETHSQDANPLYTNAAAADLTLQASSPAIDAGQVLTTAVGSGSGTTLTVADAGYFHDGYGLIAGDTIQIGTTAAVVLSSVNYTTNVLTLASSRTWSSGDGVSLSYSGAQPDMGAFEFEGSPPPQPAAFMFLFR